MLLMVLGGLLMTALAVSMDACWCGFALGGKQVRLHVRAGLSIGAWSFGLSLATALAGNMAQRIVPEGWMRIASGTLLCCVAIMAFREAWFRRRGQQASPCETRDVRPGEGAMVGVAVALDASLAALSLGALGVPIWLVASAMAVGHAGLVLLGNWIGLRSIGRLTGWYIWLPGVLLLTQAVRCWAG